MRTGATRHDDGFSLIETVVSLVVIGIVATSFATFLVGANRISHGTSSRDTAAQVAMGGMERARSVRGAALLSGRAQCGSGNPCDPPVSSAVTAYLGASAQRWDAPGTGAATLPTPADPEVVQLDGVRFARYYYLARCWQTAASDGSTASRPCTESAAGSSYPAEYVRVVVAVTWAGPDCGGGCSYVTATLMSASAADPYLDS
jgi:prepilin-type N-terminal cleavage/methylation domain-containing protein